jgi:hypothetical protein
VHNSRRATWPRRPHPIEFCKKSMCALVSGVPKVLQFIDVEAEANVPHLDE